MHTWVLSYKEQCIYKLYRLSCPITSFIFSRRNSGISINLSGDSSATLIKNFIESRKNDKQANLKSLSIRIALSV
ncbi:unnamed protein product [Oikopleura dioica]|uniref:Uncharacterized protein n=1 Tax=Oikopleura dioica TaxID=34765 RepID=E4Y403_OIKDI|nr:unnamed protein product [Oikopleura dioica]